MSFFANTSAQNSTSVRKVLNINVDQLNSNQQAVPVKYLAGRNYVAGDYISPAYNPKAIPIKTQVGKGGGEVTGFKYYADFALAFCMGGRRPVDAVYTVIVDSDIVWSGNITRGSAQKEIITVPNYGLIHLYWGGESQIIDNILLTPRATPIGGGNQQDNTTFPPNAAVIGQTTEAGLASGDANPYSGHYDTHPAYRGQCYGVFINWKLGRDRTSIPNIQLELKRGCPWFNNGLVPSDNRGVNPAAFLFDMFTDTRFGAGFPEASLGVTKWGATYNALEALSARISPLISTEMEFRQLVADTLEYFNGFIRRNGNTIELGMWNLGNPTSVATLTDDDLLGDPELTPTGWNSTLNEITVVYKDRIHHFNDYAQVYRSATNFRITGAPRPETVQRPWITDKDLAKAYVTQYGALQALPYLSGDLHVKREWLSNNNVLPGQIITYNSAFYALSFLLRLDQVEYPADKDAKATLTVEWDRSKWPSLYIAPGFQGPGGFVMGPRAVWKLRITEVPYLLHDKKFLTQVVCLGVKGNYELAGFRVWASFDGGQTYQDLANSNHFGYYGKTDAAFADTGGAVTMRFYGVALDQIETQTPAQQNDDTLLCFIEAEVLSIGIVGPLGGGRFNVGFRRGRLGTTRVAHAANLDAFFIFRSQMREIDNAQFVPGQVILFKLQPFTHMQDFDLTSITPVSYTVVGWGNIAPPTLTPPGGPFVTSVSVHATAQAGMKIRYEESGAEVNGTSPLFPVAGKAIRATTTLRVRAFASNGRVSQERIAHYTKVQQIPGVPPPTPDSQCSPPDWDFSGNIGTQAGNLTLTATTSGSVIKFMKNGGATQNYSSPIHLACTAAGDTCEFWATKSGLDDSAHSTVDNTQQELRGGGQGPPIQP
jgi:hypothetical protein